MKEIEKLSDTSIDEHLTIYISEAEQWNFYY